MQNILSWLFHYALNFVVCEEENRVNEDIFQLFTKVDIYSSSLILKCFPTFECVAHSQETNADMPCEIIDLARNAA